MFLSCKWLKMRMSTSQLILFFAFVRRMTVYSRRYDHIRYEHKWDRSSVQITCTNIEYIVTRRTQWNILLVILIGLWSRDMSHLRKYSRNINFLCFVSNESVTLYLVINVIRYGCGLYKINAIKIQISAIKWQMIFPTNNHDLITLHVETITLNILIN